MCESLYAKANECLILKNLLPAGGCMDWLMVWFWSQFMSPSLYLSGLHSLFYILCFHDVQVGFWVAQRLWLWCRVVNYHGFEIVIPALVCLNLWRREVFFEDWKRSWVRSQSTLTSMHSLAKFCETTLKSDTNLIANGQSSVWDMPLCYSKVSFSLKWQQKPPVLLLGHNQCLRSNHDTHGS